MLGGKHSRYSGKFIHNIKFQILPESGEFYRIYDNNIYLTSYWCGTMENLSMCMSICKLSQSRKNGQVFWLFMHIIGMKVV